MIKKGLPFYPNKKRGHRCVFTIEIENISCLIQQQQQQMPSSARKSLLSGLKIAEHLGNLINDNSSNAGPPTGYLHKRVVITWKRGNKKKGKVATATFNTITNAYEFDNLPPNAPAVIQFVGTMEPLEKSNSNPQSLLEIPYKRKDLKITLEEYTEGADLATSQLPNLLTDKRKICSYEYDLSDCFMQMKQHHQRLGEKCPVTVPLMTLTPKSFAKLSMLEKKKSSSGLLSNVGRGLNKAFATKKTETNPEHNVGGLLLMKMNVVPNFVNSEDEETVNSDTVVSTDNLMTDEYASDLEEEIMVRERSASSERVSLDLPRDQIRDVSPRRVSIDGVTGKSPDKSRMAELKRKLVYVSPGPTTPEPVNISIEPVQSNKVPVVDTSVVEPKQETKSITTVATVVPILVEKQDRTPSPLPLSQLDPFTPEPSTPTPTFIFEPQEYANMPNNYEQIVNQSVSPVVVNTQVNVSEHVEMESRELRQRLSILEMEFSSYKHQAEQLLSSEVNKASQVADELRRKVSDLETELSNYKQEAERLLNQEREKAVEINEKYEQRQKFEQDNELLNMQLRVLESTNKNLQNELSKMRIRLKQQESKLLSVQQTQQQQQQVHQLLQQSQSIEEADVERKEHFHPFVIAAFWGLLAAICTVLSFPFAAHVFQSNSLDKDMDLSEYIFRQCLAGFGTYALFTFFALLLAKQLQLHMYGTYLISFLKAAPSLDYHFFAVDGDFIGNAKSSSLWGLCLGFIIKFVDWLFLFRWVRPATQLIVSTQEILQEADIANATIAATEMPSVVSMNFVPFWKKVFYSVYCGVADELVGRLFMFLLFIELLRRLRRYKINQKQSSGSSGNSNQRSIPILDKLLVVVGPLLSLASVELEKRETSDTDPAKESQEDDPDAVVIGGGLNKLVVTAMVLSSILFAITKCSWEMTMYPPSSMIVWIIALVRCIFIHGSTAMVFAYMFFIQENIEFAMLAHIVYELVMQW